MSLVVAMIDSGRLHICSDLRVTQPNIQPEGSRRHTPNYFNGVLKVVPISKSTAVAYAGTVTSALEAIRNIAAMKVSFDEIPQELIKMFEENPDECDFLIIDASKPKIYQIKSNKLTVINQGRTWIGNVDAYNAFQEQLDINNYNSAPNPIAKSSIMMNSMDAVIENSSIESVGELPIHAFNHNGELQFSVGFSATGPGLSFGSDMNQDALILNLTVPVERGVAAVGIFLTQFHQGALYLPLVRDEPYIIDGNTIGEFRTRVMSNHAIELLGGGFE